MIEDGRPIRHGPDPVDLDGQVAVVTGGSNGIGLAVARELDRRGCRVVVASRDRQRVERAVASLRRAVGFGDCNVRSRESVEALFDFVDRRFGTLDILVTSAGIGRGESASRPMPDAVASLAEIEWDEVVATNCKGVFLAATAAARRMAARGRGQIVNISSARGAKRGLAYGASYCASKMAVRALFEAMAIELGPLGVRVMELLPDAVDTDLIRGSKLAHRGAMAPDQVGRFVADALVMPMDAVLSHLLLAPAGHPQTSSHR